MTACTYNKVGQVFYSDGWQKPDGLCSNAWLCMREYVFALSHGGKDFFDGWLKDDEIGPYLPNNAEILKYEGKQI